MKQKREKLMRALSYADDEYITEAAPRGKKPKRKFVKWTILAATLGCLLVAFNLWLFVPYDTELPDVSMYADSPYYEVIQKISTKYISKERNNFKRYFIKTDIFRFFLGLFRENNDSESLGPTATGQIYQETTDNQVQGIIEGDLVKRSDRYAYHLASNSLRIYSIEQENSVLVGEYTVVDRAQNRSFGSERCMYLSEDCKTVTLIFSDRFTDSSENRVTVISLDVSDPHNIVKKNVISVAGEYLTSRVIDGSLLLLTTVFFSDLGSSTVDFADESTFVPQITTEEGTECLAPEQIILPQTVLYANSYVTAFCLDAETLEAKDAIAVLTLVADVYITDDCIYVPHYFYKNTATSDYTMNEIIAISYKNGFEKLGSVCVKGYVNNQYSMDEYDGVLRVVTTVGDGTESNASLYCIDLQTWEIVSSVKKFAPKGESVRSVRFDGDAAYVCTAIEVTDPVFFFDLSDVKHITYKKSAMHDGFSHSLVSFGDGYCLGIGLETVFKSIKIEIYKETDSGVESVCKYVKDVYCSNDYKDYLVDREKRIIGFSSYSALVAPIVSYYTLLWFDGESLQVITEIVNDGQTDRAVYIDGYLYLFGENFFKVEKVTIP